MIDRLCRRARVHFSDALDGEPLSWGAAFQVRMHRMFCPMCRRTYRALELLKESLRQLRDDDADA